MKLLLFNNPIEGCVFNHPLVMSCLIWAVTIVILGVLVFFNKRHKAQIKYEMAKADQDHEINMKKVAFKIDDYWYNIKKEGNNNEEIRKLKEEIEKLKNGEKVKELEKELKQKETEIDLLKKQLDLYKEAIDNLHVELRTK